MKPVSQITTLSLLLTTVSASGQHRSGQSPSSSVPGWNLKNFKTLVTFGDSYTDDSRLSYFILNGGKAPPVGWVNPVNYHAADGGRPWPNYVQQYAGVDLYNYAVAGAVCSNNVTPRFLPTINADFPAVAEYEVPAYLADSHYVTPSGARFFDGSASDTVYSIWIGHNDLGVGAFLTDNQVAGTTLVNYTQCVYDSLQSVYANGGRYFVLMNLAPLNLAPLYALPGHGDSGNNQYWPNKASTSNATDVSLRMMNQIAAVNAIFDYQTPFLAKIAGSFPGAHFAVMDTNGFLRDVYNNPARYLNGTAPLSVTDYINHCDVTGSNCVAAANPDSFMWYDALHISEQTERMVARAFVDVVKGKSPWAKYWSC